jgi:uncharacterized protein (DUF58 family)
VSSSVLDGAVLQPALKQGVLGQTVQLARWCARIVLSPVRLFLSIRRSMTAASVSLLLIGIITMNIVWGYPWVGMFSACASLMFVGFAINRIMCPSLKIDFSLPNSSPAGQPFPIVAHVMNQRSVPAMDLKVCFGDGPGHRRKHRRSKNTHGCWAPAPPQSLPLILPAERRDLHASLLNDRRGIHALPNLVVTSMFPFHLFRSSRHVASEAHVAITPRAMTGDEDAVSRGVLDALGGWSHRLLSGDALDYTGSREYEVGMPVRRWDFKSWARLGRPIVREFQSPSIQMVTLIVDTSTSDGGPDDQSQNESPVERVLSLAATAINDLTRKMVRVRLYVTSESPSSLAGIGPTHAPSDSETLLIRLAGAEFVSPLDADSRVQEVLEHLGRSPGLILTARRELGLQQNLPPNVSILNVAPPLYAQFDGRQSQASDRPLPAEG